MEREEEAKIAIAGLNGHEFEGSQLNVEVCIDAGCVLYFSACSCVRVTA